MSETGASIGDILATSIAGITLIVTLLLVLIAIRIGSDMTSVLRRVETIELEKKGTSRELHATQALMEIFRRQSDANFQMIVNITNAISSTEVMDKREVNNLLAADLASYIKISDRYLMYLLLLKESDSEEFAMRLNNICSICPDEITLEFLNIAREIVTSSARDQIQSGTRALRSKLYGIDSFQWTGMR